MVTSHHNQETWQEFLKLCAEHNIFLIPSDFLDELEIMKLCNSFTIDLDDAHQYWAAKKWVARFISFDKDFDSTDLKREEPKDIFISTSQNYV